MAMLIGFALGIVFACIVIRVTAFVALDCRTWRVGNTRTFVIGYDRPWRVNVTRQSWVHGLGYRVSWRVGRGALRAFTFTWARPIPYRPRTAVVLPSELDAWNERVRTAMATSGRVCSACYHPHGPMDRCVR